MEGDALGSRDLEYLVVRLILERTGENIRVLFPAVADRVAQTMVDDIAHRCLKAFVILSRRRNHQDLRSGRDGVSPLHIQRNLEIPPGEYAEIRTGGLTYGINHIEVRRRQRRQASEVEKGI